jgi:lipopolysaccharide assembly outer membrane protein LptD (OstA)
VPANATGGPPPKGRAVRVFALVALLVVVVAPVAAQQAPTFFPPPFEQTKQQRLSFTAGVHVLSGDVELSLATDGVTIHTDEAEYRQSPQDTVLRGSVFLTFSSPAAMTAMTGGDGTRKLELRSVSMGFGAKRKIIHADEADFDNTTKTLHLRGNVRLEFVKDTAPQ